MLDFNASLEKHAQYPPWAVGHSTLCGSRLVPQTEALTTTRCALEAEVVSQVSELREGLEGCGQTWRVSLLMGEHLAPKPPITRIIVFGLGRDLCGNPAAA